MKQCGRRLDFKIHKLERWNSIVTDYKGFGTG